MSGRSKLNTAQVTSRGSPIEQTRKYRLAPTVPTTAFPCELVQAAKRPGHGTKGESVQLLANWFRIKKLERIRIFIYEIIVTQQGRKGAETITHPPTVSKIFWKTVHKYRELSRYDNRKIFQNVHRIVFDDRKYAFTPDKTGIENGITCTCEHPDMARKEVIIQFKCHEWFDLDMSGNIDSNPGTQWSSIFLKNLFSQRTRYKPPETASAQEMALSRRFAHEDGGMFVVPGPGLGVFKVEISPGVQAWLGLYASVRRMEDFNPIMNFGLMSKLFVELNLDLITFYRLIEGESLADMPMQRSESTRLCMSADQARNFVNKLRDIKLKCECAPVKDKDDIVTGPVLRHYKFVDLDIEKSADREMLYVEDPRAKSRFLKEVEIRRGRNVIKKEVYRKWKDVRMDQWYAANGIELKYPKLPLCMVKSGKKLDLVPMEVLFTHDQPQKYIKLLNFYARLKITKKLCRSPAQHHKLTNDLVTGMLEPQHDPFLRGMNISLDPKMIECEGRVVEPCAVLGKSRTGDTVDKMELNKESGQFAVSRAMETSNKKIRFLVYRLTDAIGESSIREFYREFARRCVNRGFFISAPDQENPPIFEDLSRERRDRTKLAKTIEDHLALFEKGKSEDEIPVFIFITKLVDDLYGQIKFLCDIQHGIVSQVIDEDTVRKGCSKREGGDAPSDYKSVYHHICLKLNAKLGGVNQILADPDEPEYGRMPRHERTMFIGIDVIHPSPNSPIRDASLAAIVASVDKNAAKYAVRIKVNSRCNESVQQFDEHFAHLIHKYYMESFKYDKNGYVPERVVILRDGVSDSEMVKAASEEIHSIKTAWKKTLQHTDVPGKECPPFTYIVVQKNHKTRFYKRPDEEGAQVSNPPMGTVVDKEVVTPHMFDFYMVSHYTEKGTTTRPIHYTVVYDECDSSADAIQELLFRMCFLYARCSKPVSLPSPVYYAHLACERAAAHHEYAINSNEYKEIEDKRERESDDQYSSRVGNQVMMIEKKLQTSLKYPGMYFI